MTEPTPFPGLTPGRYTVHADGANAGPGKATGVGIVVAGPRGPVGECGYPAGPGTSNTAEIDAAVVALTTLPHGSVVEIVTDSEYVVKTMSGQYGRWANLDRWAALEAAVGRMAEVTFRHVKGHAGDPSNERADGLARAARRRSATRSLPAPWSPPPASQDTRPQGAGDRRTAADAAVPARIRAADVVGDPAAVLERAVRAIAETPTGPRSDPDLERCVRSARAALTAYAASRKGSRNHPGR